MTEREGGELTKSKVEEEEVREKEREFRDFDI